LTITRVILMDMFEKTMESVSKKTTKEQADLIADFKTKCPCPSCPTYNGCASKAGEKLFCINGKSFMCISDDKGCTCPQCPVGKSVGLKYQKFCLKGSEMAQRYENTLWGTSLNR
jgi:hypothetical protein